MLKVKTTCLCCGSTQREKHFEALLRCCACGHVMADLDLDPSAYKDLYSPEYFEQGEYFSYIKDRSCFEKNFNQRLASIRRFQSQGKLLEIGAASGFFLNLARENYQVEGYEICAEMARYARDAFKLDVKSTDFLDDDLKVESYDMVVMWDVIEHLSNPQDFFRKIHGLLKQGAYVVFTTGDIASAMARFQKAKWRLIHPPTHVHYFTRHSVIKFLEGQGFKVCDIHYPGYYRSLRQMLYGTVLSQNKKWWASLQEKSWGGWPLYLNLFDIMQVTARKT